MVLRLTNAQARRLLLAETGLSAPLSGRPSPGDLHGLVKKLGFVQLDSIQTVARAHHHILWSRCQGYREPMLARLLEDDRTAFDHWARDAAVMPVEWYPHWHHRFSRAAERIKTSKSWQKRLGDRKILRDVRKRIERTGPVLTRDFAGDSQRTGSWWGWSPHKAALEYLWHTGDLATAGRQGFQKIYDLSDRVIPDGLHAEKTSPQEHLDWACSSALDRLIFANPRQIRDFWDVTALDEVRRWTQTAPARDIIPVEIAPADDGAPIAAFAPADIEARLETAPAPQGRLRLLNPFDPLIHDRIRTERIFGFSYRIEVFVPAPKRQYGYYVFPMLEGDRFIGRLDAVGDRAQKSLTVRTVWPEPGIRFGKDRRAKLDAELARLARFIGAERIEWEAPHGL